LDLAQLLSGIAKSISDHSYSDKCCYSTEQSVHLSVTLKHSAEAKIKNKKPIDKDPVLFWITPCPSEHFCSHEHTTDTCNTCH